MLRLTPDVEPREAGRTGGMDADLRTDLNDYRTLQVYVGGT